jgi:hypothetical protein
MLTVIGTLINPATGVAIEALHGKIGKIAVAAKTSGLLQCNPIRQLPTLQVSPCRLREPRFMFRQKLGL